MCHTKYTFLTENISNANTHKALDSAPLTSAKSVLYLGPLIAVELSMYNATQH